MYDVKKNIQAIKDYLHENEKKINLMNIDGKIYYRISPYLKEMKDYLDKNEDKVDIMNIEEKRYYYGTLKSYRDTYNCMDYAYKKGLKLAAAEDIAKNLKAMNLPKENIAQATGLSIEKIENL